MKTILATTAALVLFCGTVLAEFPIKQGSVFINRFETNAYKTSNPFDIKQDFVDHIIDELHIGLISSFNENSNLAPVSSCDANDYKITGKVVKINYELKRQLLGETVRIYDITVEGTLSKCDGNKIQDFSAKTINDDLEEGIEDLARRIVTELRGFDKLQ